MLYTWAHLLKTRYFSYVNVMDPLFIGLENNIGVLPADDNKVTLLIAI